MRAFLGLAQVVHRAARYDVNLEIDVILKHFPERQYLRLPVYNGKHDDAERHLHL